MKIKIPLISEQIDISSEAAVNVVVIENQNAFYEFLKDCSNQINNNEYGNVVMSRDNEPVEMSKYAEIISDFLSLNINCTNMVTKLHKKINSTMTEQDFWINTQQVCAEVKKNILNISDFIDFSIDIGNEFDVLYLLKAAGVKFYDDYNSLSEKLLAYIINSYKLGNKKCFILVNLRDYISNTDIENFYKSILYNKLKVLIVSSKDYPVSKYEKKVIIDKDLCVI